MTSGKHVMIIFSPTGFRFFEEENYRNTIHKTHPTEEVGEDQMFFWTAQVSSVHKSETLPIKPTAVSIIK